MAKIYIVTVHSEAALEKALREICPEEEFEDGPGWNDTFLHINQHDPVPLRK